MTGKKLSTLVELTKAAEVGLDLSKELVKAFPLKHPLQNRFRTLIFALSISNPTLRTLLLDDKILMTKFVLMEEKDLASDDAKIKMIADKEYAMQAKRTDAVLEQQLKKGVMNSLYSCGRCGSKKISMYTQQTRGADEPMTEFYNCLECGKKWRICP